MVWLRQIWIGLSFIVLALPNLSAEHVILAGGPADRRWEDLRVEEDRHDRWWGNFIRASTIRIDEIRQVYGENAPVTWIVYRPGYVIRGRAEGKPYLRWIEGNASKRGVNLVWIDSGSQAIRAINRPRSGRIVTFDFFGHSNKHCFMLDYGSEVIAASKAWIHEDELRKINRRAFDKNALCQSWGCHTGESMSQKWKSTLGVMLIGCTGKTDYRVVGEGKLPYNSSGRWIR